MKKLGILAASVAVFFALLFLSGCGDVATGQVTNPISVSSQQQGIWVTGTGTVTVTPDIANISLGIQAQDTTVAAAQATANQAMNQVMAALTASGIAAKDIQTQQFSIYQLTRYDQNRNDTVITGYQVSNIVNVKIRNIADAGKIIDEVAKAGGDNTRINNIYFTVEEPEKYYSEARQKAMEDAKTTAEQLASNGGVTLGPITYISAGGVSIPSPIYYSKMAADAAPMPSTPISSGETDIVLNVQVIYSIR